MIAFELQELTQLINRVKKGEEWYEEKNCFCCYGDGSGDILVWMRQ